MKVSQRGGHKEQLISVLTSHPGALGLLFSVPKKLSLDAVEVY